MSAAFLTDFGGQDTLISILAGMAHMRWALGTADITPGRGTTLAQLVEANWPGYNRQQARWGPPQTDPATGLPFAIASPITWVRGNGAFPPANVFTWAVLDGANVVWAGRFSTAPISVVFPGSYVQLSPVQYQLCQCSEGTAGGVSLEGGFGLGGFLALTHQQPLMLAGGLGLGGFLALTHQQPLMLAGGFGLGGFLTLTHQQPLMLAGGFGLGGFLSLSGGRSLPLSGGMGLGGSLTLSGASGGPTVYLKDTFSGSSTLNTGHTMDVGPGWGIVFGTWQTSGTGTDSTSTATTSDPGDYKVSYGGVSDGTETVQFTFGVTGTITGAGLVFRYVGMASTGYRAWVWDENSQLRLDYFTSSGHTNVATASVPGLGTSTHTLKVVCSGTSVSVYLDGTLYITYTDPHSTAGATHWGLFALYDTGSAPVFDNFLVTA